MPRGLSTDAQKRAHEMKHFVERHCAEDLKLEHLSLRFGYSQGHICRLFKTHFGMGFVDCLTLARVKLAKRLLRQTRAPIYEIAVRSGFNFRDYFFKVFKKSEGVTPRRYRLMHRDP